MGAYRGKAAPPPPDKNANVDIITGAKLGIFAMLVAFLFGGPFGLILLAGMLGTALGWVMSKDINR
jgi:hypothetical protein